MTTEIVPRTFIDKLNEDNIHNFLFKIEYCSYEPTFTTQDCKPFQDFEYKKIGWTFSFVDWLEQQQLLKNKYGIWQEVTEIWHLTSSTNMELIWTKKQGWLDKEWFTKGDKQ